MYVIARYLMLVSYAITNLAWYVSIVGIDIIVAAPQSTWSSFNWILLFLENSANDDTYMYIPSKKLIKMFIFPDLDELILQMVILHKTFNNHFLLACKIPNCELH